MDDSLNARARGFEFGVQTALGIDVHGRATLRAAVEGEVHATVHLGGGHAVSRARIVATGELRKESVRVRSIASKQTVFDVVEGVDASAEDPSNVIEVF